MKSPALVALTLLSVSVLNAYASETQNITVQGRLTCCIRHNKEQGPREPLQRQAGPRGPTIEVHHPWQEPGRHRLKRDGGSHGEFNRPDAEWQPERGDQGGLANYGEPGWASPPGLKPVRDGDRDRDFRQDSSAMPDGHAWAEGSWEDRNAERRREDQDGWRRPPEGPWDRDDDRSSHHEQWGAVEAGNGRLDQLEMPWGDGSRGKELSDSRQWQEEQRSQFKGRRKNEFDSAEEEGPSGPLPLNWRHKRAHSSRAQCFDEPQQNALVQLYAKVMAAKDNLLAEAHTDRTGDFKLTGNEAENVSIGRYLIINHHCSEAVGKELNQGCSFETRVEVPEEYINDNPLEINSLEALVKSGHSVSTKQYCP